MNKDHRPAQYRYITYVEGALIALEKDFLKEFPTKSIGEFFYILMSTVFRRACISAPSTQAVIDVMRHIFEFHSKKEEESSSKE